MRASRYANYLERKNSNSPLLNEINQSTYSEHTFSNYDDELSISSKEEEIQSDKLAFEELVVIKS